MDPAAAYGMDGWPFWLVVVALYVIVMFRSHATYWLGRAVSAGARLEAERRVGPRRWLALLDRIDTWSGSSQAQHGIRLVHRWGPVGVAVTYLTVGLHSAVVLAAGLVRMPYLRFTVASLVGSALWAVVWSTIGLGALWAVTRSWWGAAALVVVVAVGVVVLRRRRQAQAQAQEAPAQDVAGRSTALP